MKQSQTYEEADGAFNHRCSPLARRDNDELRGDGGREVQQKPYHKAPEFKSSGSCNKSVVEFVSHGTAPMYLWSVLAQAPVWSEGWLTCTPEGQQGPCL